MGEIHELSVLALSLVWFAGATPDICQILQRISDFEEITPKVRWDFPKHVILLWGYYTIVDKKDTIDRDMKAKWDNIISEWITFTITKAKAKTNSGGGGESN